MPRVDFADDRAITRKLVHVNFMKFVEVEASGREIQSERPSALGYIVYNGEFQEFGQWVFSRSDDYTLESDVRDRIQEHHPRLAEAVHEMKGFYLCGQWCSTDPEGTSTH